MNSADRSLDSDPTAEVLAGDSVIQSIRAAISHRWRELAGFSLLFRIFEGLLCSPLIALVGKWLLGRTVLDSTALLSFLLSWRGILMCLLGATALLTIRLVEHAGLSAIFFGTLDGRQVTSFEAARIVWRYLFSLARVSARFV